MMTHCIPVSKLPRSEKESFFEFLVFDAVEELVPSSMHDQSRRKIILQLQLKYAT